MEFFARRRTAPHGSRVGSTYDIPVDSLTPTQLQDEKAALTLQAHQSYGTVKPPPFTVWEVHDGVLSVPRFYGLKRYGTPEVDERSLGQALPASLAFAGTLSETQTEASRTVLGRHLRPDGIGGTMICLPCGLGKTVLAVFLSVTLGRRTVVLVHKAVIRDQWIAAFEKFCPGARVGVVQGGTDWQTDGYDVVIAMVLTLAKREQTDTQLFDWAGTVVVDECHHMAARVMNRAMRWFRARYIIALTADKERADGMTPLLHHILGPEGYRAERKGTESVRVSIATYEDPGLHEKLSHDGKPLMSLMLNQIANNPRRNAFIADRVAKMRAAGRVVLVLSDRLRQLETLNAMLRERGVAPDDIGIFCGSTKESDRQEQLGRGVVLCSYAMANEGVDKREADTCVMATPKGRVIQCIGRVQRPCENKKAPLVIDIADQLSIFTSMRWKRQKMYRNENYEVQVLPALTTADDAWFA